MYVCRCCAGDESLAKFPGFWEFVRTSRVYSGLAITTGMGSIWLHCKHPNNGQHRGL